jgi:hypothetical protein
LAILEAQPSPPTKERSVLLGVDPWQLEKQCLQHQWFVHI